MTLITRDRIDQIAAELTAAGDDWQATATALPELARIRPGDDLYRDIIDLATDVQWGEASSYPGRLYRHEDGTWWACGWSPYSQGLIFRPTGFVWDPDAGVHVPTGPLELAELADHIGVSYATIRRYRSQDPTFPQPDVMLGQSPGWYLPTLERWVDSRPGQGVGGGRPRKA